MSVQDGWTTSKKQDGRQSLTLSLTLEDASDPKIRSCKNPSPPSLSYGSIPRLIKRSFPRNFSFQKEQLSLFFQTKSALILPFS